MPVPQIPNPLPGSPGGNYPGFIPNYMYYFKQSATVEQYYQARNLLGFGYASSSVLNVYFHGAHDVNAVDVVAITLSAGTTHSDAAEYILNSVVYQQVHPTYHHIIRVCVTGGSSFRPEFVSCTITYGECCGGGRSTMDYWILSDGSTTQQVDNTETVTFADGTFINNVVSATNTVTTDLSAVDGTAVAGTRFLSKDNTWDVPITGVSGTLNQIPKFTSTTAIGDSSMANPVDGAVTITGTTTPSLSLYKASNERLLINASDSYSQFTNKATSHMLFKTSGGTNALTIQESNDRVGVGTTGALSEFHVVGNITMVDGNESAGRILTCDAAGTGSWAAPAASGCADVYKTITNGSAPFSASGCTDTLTIESPNGSISVNTSTQDTVKLELDKGKYEAMTITLTDENRVMTDGIKYQFRMPYAFTLADYHTVASNCGDAVTAHINVAPSGGEEGAFQVKIDYSTHTSGAGSWTALTSTNIHIDHSELTSQTAATQPVLSKTTLACGEWLRFEVTQSTGAERGLKVNLVGYQTALA
tara:strand:+ start:274 stop:1872 length:1599 start_codon:yes stop_codon:yes gene_type:complete